MYNEKEARDLVSTLLQAVKYCHDRGIVHRDLKVGVQPRQVVKTPNTWFKLRGMRDAGLAPARRHAFLAWSESEATCSRCFMELTAIG